MGCPKTKCGLPFYYGYRVFIISTIAYNTLFAMIIFILNNKKRHIKSNLIILIFKMPFYLNNFQMFLRLFNKIN